MRIAFWNVAGLGNKDRKFWKGMKEWDVMSETWLEEKGWKRIRDRMTKGFRWEAQMASRKNRKRRAIGRMVIGVRNGTEMIEETGERVTEGIMKKMIKIGGGGKWRIVGVYANMKI